MLVFYINYFHIINVPWLRLQVKSGTLFDSILVCDYPEYEKKLADETWRKQKDVSCFLETILFSYLLYFSRSTGHHTFNMLKLHFIRLKRNILKRKRKRKMRSVYCVLEILTFRKIRWINRLCNEM